MGQGKCRPRAAPKVMTLAGRASSRWRHERAPSLSCSREHSSDNTTHVPAFTSLSGVWGGRDASEGKGPQRQPQQRLGRRLEEVAAAVGGGYCRRQMPLKLALAVRGTVAGHRLGARDGGWGYVPPFPMHPWGGGGVAPFFQRTFCERRPGPVFGS